jgi:RNA polymerase sigma-70 factor (ECF subfamily)
MATNSQYLTSKDLYPATVAKKEPADSALMEGIALGDEQALMTLYDRYSSLVFSLSWHVLRDHHSAEDVLQEVFLRLWRGAKQCDKRRGSLAVWLTVITRHFAIDQLRRRRSEEPWSDDLPTIQCSQNSEPNHLLNIDMVRVRSILDLLPKEQREALGLAYFGGFTGAEIAAQIGEPLGTVKSRIRLALQAIRRLLLVPRSKKSDRSMQRVLN